MKKEDQIWNDLDKYINSIRNEVQMSKPDWVSIDFWLFKIERRIEILKNEIEK